MPVRLGKNTFLGNHVVIAGGQQLPDDILLGVRIRPPVVLQIAAEAEDTTVQLPRVAVASVVR